MVLPLRAPVASSGCWGGRGCIRPGGSRAGARERPGLGPGSTRCASAGPAVDGEASFAERLKKS